MLNCRASDFENPELIEQGIRFGRDMWERRIRGFEKYQNRQPQKVTDLGRKLIEYYSDLVLK